MLVARSFTYASDQHKGSNDSASQQQRPKSKKKGRSSEEAMRGFGWRPDSYVPPEQSERDQEQAPTTMQPTSLPPNQPRRQKSSSSSPRPSRPVDVPLRTRREIPRSVPENIPRKKSEGSNNVHDPRGGVTPSVAALLAMTTIPKRSFAPRTRSGAKTSRKMSLSELVEEWKQLDNDRASFGTSPNMEILLAPPDEDETCLESVGSNESFKGRYLSSRSVSSESMPSLDGDSRSTMTLTPPLTPKASWRRLSGCERKDKVLASPPSIECDADHPLLFDSISEDSSEFDPSRFTRRKPSTETYSQSRKDNLRLSKSRRASYFKSNLTASLSALRSAARSFSNFAAPYIPPDDHLSHGIFGIPYRSEMRPRPIDGVPTAQMRRYLNPVHHRAPGDFHLHDSHLDHTDLEAAASPATAYDLLSGISPPESIIALQAFDSNARAITDTHNKRDGNASSSSNTLKEANSPSQRPRREPRENNEFLRICVLEMNMRRSGKMEGPIGTGSGRRAFWLSPREVDVEVEVEVDTDAGVDMSATRSANTLIGRRTVPKRWIGTSA